MKWLIIGAGVSGLGAAKLLTKKGESVRVSDAVQLKDEKAQAFRELAVDLIDGRQTLSHLDDITHVVASPGLPQSHPLLVEARQRGLTILSEIDLAMAEFKGRLIGVTGTNGKSTTCAMIHHILQRAGYNSSLGGNFGDPPSALIAEGRVGDVLVLELSSYQLELSEGLKPEVAIFTSFSHDHLGRHGTMAAYLRTKWKLCEALDANGLAIVPQAVMALIEEESLSCRGRILRQYRHKDKMTALGQPGYFIEDSQVVFNDGSTVSLIPTGIDQALNRLNASFALLAVAQLTGRSLDDLTPLLAGFRPLAHRCEPLGTIGGRPVVNDSKSTNVESTLVALTGQSQPIILMMGGQGKGESYLPLLEAKAKIAALITFGASGRAIARDLEHALPTLTYATLKIALDQIKAVLDRHPNAGLLFSPGCASFDEFDNYEHRGDVFKKFLANCLDTVKS